MRAAGSGRGAGRRRPCRRSFLRSRHSEQMRCSSGYRNRPARRLRRPSPTRWTDPRRAVVAGRPEFRSAEAEVRPEAVAARLGVGVVVGAEAAAAAVEGAGAVEAAAAAQPAEAEVEAVAEAEAVAEEVAAGAGAAEVEGAAVEGAVVAAVVEAAEAGVEAVAEAEAVATGAAAGAALRPARSARRRAPRTRARREVAATAGASSPHPYNVRGAAEVARQVARD
jgi:hypothetical protein